MADFTVNLSAATTDDLYRAYCLLSADRDRLPSILVDLHSDLHSELESRKDSRFLIQCHIEELAHYPFVQVSLLDEAKRALLQAHNLLHPKGCLTALKGELTHYDFSKLLPRVEHPAVDALLEQAERTLALITKKEKEAKPQ